MENSRNLLLAEIEQFMGASGINKTQFGIQSCQRGGLVQQLRDGRDVSLTTADKIRKFMRNEEAKHDGFISTRRT